MQDLPNLLLSYGIELRTLGSEYITNCISHDDKKPSMSVYLNDNGNWTAHCFSCGFHQGAVGVYCELKGLDVENKQHIADAIKALDSDSIVTGKPFAKIMHELPKKTPRTMINPPENSLPKMDWLQTKDSKPFGDPVAVWAFRNPVGEPIMYEARYHLMDEDTGEIKKECRVFTYGRRGSEPARWSCAHYEGKRPIYAQDNIIALHDKQVIVCEGARKAEAAQKLFPKIPCTGWTGGANSWSKSDWSLIAGRNVLLWPDADEVGRDAMDALAQHLIEQDCKVWIFDTNDMPEAWDAADAVDEGWDTEQALTWAKEHKGVEVEKKTHTETVKEIELPPVSAYEMQGDLPALNNEVFPYNPVDVFQKFIVPPLQRGLLPKIIEDYIFDRAEVINTDPAYGALTAIVTCAALIDDRIKIRVAHDWTESARLWGCIVGEPSAKKSPIMDAVLNSSARAIVPDIAAADAAVQRKQNILDKRYQAKLKEYEKACIESDNHNELAPIPPDRLERQRVLCDNLTREGLEEVLRDMPSGVLVTSDEISGWIGSMDAYKAAGVKADRAFWLRAYNGGSMQVDKVGRGSFLIENWSCSIIGGIQPSRMAAIAKDLDGDGLLQRFLVVCSEREGGIGADRAPDAEATKEWKELSKHLYSIKHHTHIEMSEGAQQIRRDAIEKIYDLIAANTISTAFCTHMGKWDGISARLILIYHVVDCASRNVHPSSEIVSPETAQMAIGYMMNHLLPHAVSFYEDGLVGSDVHETITILGTRIIADRMEELTMRWLGRNSPSKFRSMTEDKQRQVLARMIELGWLHPVGFVDTMTRRYGRYLVNPAVHTIYADRQIAMREKLASARAMADKIRAGEMIHHKETVY